MTIRDNQQERLYRDEEWFKKIKSQTDWIWYIVGFSDGEGSLNVSFRKRDDYKSGWKITPVFNITQKDKSILARIKQFFGCGTLRDRKDGVWYYEVDNAVMLRTRILPFFQMYSFRTQKKLSNLSSLIQICKILDDPNWASEFNITRILEIRETMTVRKTRKYSVEFILSNIKSSETTRQTPSKEMI
jgi:hypothetical protein